MKLKVITFNIRCADDVPDNIINKRAPRLKKILDKYDADVIGLQEGTPKWLIHLENYYSDKYEIFNKFRAEREQESAPILWKKDKFELVKKGYFWLSDTPEVESKDWDEVYDCYRMCSYVILKEKESGKLFTYMNTHFGFGDKGQVASTELIYKYSHEISSYPTFITGDFNMTPDTPAYKKMTEYFTDVNAVTAKDWNTTYHGYDLNYPKKEHIDYCFIDSQIKPIDSSVIYDLVDGKFASDHYGIQFLLEI